jgi:rSAM/selenodomain-associated transferase 2
MKKVRQADVIPDRLSSADPSADEMTNNLELSVIIPTLNEEAEISRLLEELDQQIGVSFESIVVDGGSSDQTIEFASRGGARCLDSESGRGKQMNLGAKYARAPILLFLHADSSLLEKNILKNAISSFREKSQELQSLQIAGHFSLEFNTESRRKSRAYRYYEEKTRLNRCNTTNGDQGFLLSKEYFLDVGPFDEDLPFLEDQKLAENIRRDGTWFTIPAKLKTSARRFEKEGMARRMILSAIVMGLHESNFSAFFREAPALYRHQHNSDKLMLSPFCRCIHRLLRSEGIIGAGKRWLAVGRYVRENAWQIAFPIDVCLSSTLGRTSRPFLWIHDYLFRPVVTAPILEPFTAGITAVLTLCWFYSTWAYFELKDKKH